MLSIAEETPAQDGIARLMREADAHHASLYPAESNHPIYLDRLTAPDARFWVARLDGRIVGCAALIWGFDRQGEIKRMFVAPEARGKGVGRALLGAVEDGARFERLRVLRLETGVKNVEAIGLYRGAGYRPCDPFADYELDTNSIFMEKML